ncbi:MAG: hypothetical protein M4579_004228 [Chaenotheca gracillima]|nr:MAG: hypothetical protein M4579_004228 [Chaenotheca gracillima]
MAGQPLYLGFDLSTQQLKGIVITSTLEVAHVAKVDFDQDLSHYGIQKGVHKHEDAQEVFAPVAMWVEAVDLVLDRLKADGLDFSRIKGISGAGQQHGSVYWSEEAEGLLENLDGHKTLAEQLAPRAFSHANSPNWQDGSTQKQCDQFDRCLGDVEDLTRVTGSRAHHRFTGPQIMRFRVKWLEDYKATARISLVSSFLASLFLGRVAPIDIGDVCGMNLWDMDAKDWSFPLVQLAAGAGEEAAQALQRKLGDVVHDAGEVLGTVTPWAVKRYGFDPHCKVFPFTGDNPSTILALPLRPQDAIVSLGTSTTFLMSTPKFVPDPSYHLMHHPTTSGLNMFMLCYKNGGLAREKVRDQINEAAGMDRRSNSWDGFDQCIARSEPMHKKHASDSAQMGLYFPLAEIVPNVRPGVWRFSYDPSLPDMDPRKLIENEADWNLPEEDARAIVESQIFSLRLRSKNLVDSPGENLPPQPRRIYLVGGGARNDMIAQTVGTMLGGTEGVYRFHAEENGCAFGSAQKAVWANERKPGQKFDDLVAERWNEEASIRKVDQGYRPGIYEEYGKALPGFAAMEGMVLRKQNPMEEV